MDRLILRHRLDTAKLLFGKDSGYSLRKYKRIFKREMAENPDRYIIRGKTDALEDHPPKLFPLDDASQNMTKEQTK